MNNVCLVGRLTKDIEIARTSQGKAFTRFTLAVNEGDNTNFITCVAWEKTAELLNDYCQKGSMIAVTGFLKSGSYEKSDGSRVYTLDVITNRVRFLDSKKSKSESEGGFYTMEQKQEDEFYTTKTETFDFNEDMINF